jgi:hypothetical protein
MEDVTCLLPMPQNCVNGYSREWEVIAWSSSKDKKRFAHSKFKERFTGKKIS